MHVFTLVLRQCIRYTARMETTVRNRCQLGVAERVEFNRLMGLCLAGFSTDVANSMHSAHGEMHSESSPLRRLTAADRGQMVAHLAGMDTDDRYMRFGSCFGAAQVQTYVDSIDFGSHVVIGAFGPSADLVGICHLATFTESGYPVGEIGISVDRSQRGRRIGSRLMDAAFVEAALRRITEVHIYFLRSNRRMAGMCSRLGAKIAIEGDECTAKIALHPLVVTAPEPELA